MTTLICLAGVAFITGMLLIPLVRIFARWVGLVDRPDGHRKIHAQAIPLGGGLAVLLAVVLTVLVGLYVPNPLQVPLNRNVDQLIGLLAAALVLTVFGVLDDYRGLRGRQKLLGQALAALVLIGFGLVIRGVHVFGYSFPLGPLAIPFTLFWLLGAINALNLIDGIDGLASTVGIIICGALAVMALMRNNYTEAVVAIAMTGALLAFLYFNFPPASIFLGDTGSMLIGLVVGALAIRSALKGPATVALLVPTAVLAVPIFDSAVAILRRKLTGRSIYTTDRGHLHHCLLRRGNSNRRTLVWIAALCGCTAAGALISIWLKNESLAVVSMLVVVGTLVATGIFGRAEFLLLANRVRAAGASLVGQKPPVAGIRESTIRLQGTREWNLLWNELTTAAAAMDVISLRLDLNLPFLHESFHAVWERTTKPESQELCRLEYPLFARARVVGRLELSCLPTRVATEAWLEQLAVNLRSVQQHVLILVEEDAFEHANEAMIEKQLQMTAS